MSLQSVRAACFCGLSVAILAVWALPAAASDKEDAKTKEIKLRDLTLTVPEDWEFKEPTNQFRLGSLIPPAAEGVKKEAELVVYVFAGGGGGVKANIDRWIGQFEGEKRKTKLSTGESPQGKYVLVDVTGTYNMPVGPPIRMQTERLPDARMLAVILNIEGKDTYYLKFAGPQKTVDENADDFRAAFGADPKKERELKPDDQN